MRIQYYFSVLCVFVIIGVGVFFDSCKGGDSAARFEDLNQETARPDEPEEAGISVVEKDVAEEVTIKPAALILNMEEGPDSILAAYREPALQDGVVAFFGDLTGSRDLAAVVLANTAVFDIPPALAFALCWEESRYNSRAYNQNQNDTVDRGLFQLNSASFPELTLEDFYDPGTNARYGLSHLRWCLNNAGTEVAALAMYNAGSGRVRSAGTPKNTLDYISRILKRQRKIEELFTAEYGRIIPAEIGEAGKGKHAPLRLSLLTPLGR